MIGSFVVGVPPFIDLVGGQADFSHRDPHAIRAPLYIHFARGREWRGGECASRWTSSVTSCRTLAVVWLAMRRSFLQNVN